MIVPGRTSWQSRPKARPKGTKTGNLRLCHASSVMIWFWKCISVGVSLCILLHVDGPLYQSMGSACEFCSFFLRPLSMSENLAKLAHKIDFSKDESVEKGKPTSEEGVQQEEEEKTVKPLQPSQWPWDSVRTKLKWVKQTDISCLKLNHHDEIICTFGCALMTMESNPLHLTLSAFRSALTEMSVLLDVLNITKERRYMVLDPVQPPQQDTRMTFHMIGKKKVWWSCYILNCTFSQYFRYK